MDTEKFNTLTALVREAREDDVRTLAAMEVATAEWKKANAILTERLSVLNTWVNQQVNEATARDYGATQ